jgi:hypothetical protein
MQYEYSERTFGSAGDSACSEVFGKRATPAIMAPVATGAKRWIRSAGAQLKRPTYTPAAGTFLMSWFNWRLCVSSIEFEVVDVRG